jgi:PKD repeat protein
VTEAANEACGLLFAGSSSRTLANPIDAVLTRFNVTIDDGSGGGPTNSPPTASFTHDCTDLTCTFNGSGSTDSDGSITSYDWDFGDGNTGSSVEVSHTYASAGTYTVILTVTDDGGASDSESQDVTVSSSTGGDVSVTGIDPSSMQAGTTIDVTISGTGFVDGADVTFENGSGPAPTASNVVVDANNLTATVTAKSGGPPRDRVWDVRVTNPDGSTGVLAGGFTVKP